MVYKLVWVNISYVDAMGLVFRKNQWLFLVPLKGGRWHILPQLAVYTTYILPSGGLYTRNNH